MVILRQPGKRGRLPRKPAAARFPIRWLHEYTGPLDPVTYPVDVSSGIASWGMLGNDRYGDCGFAGREHYAMAKAAARQITETFQAAGDLVAEYLAYDNGQDNGVVLADVLLAWYQAGIIKAFAPVDHASPAQCDAAMAAFKGLYCGVSLTGDADQLFSEGRPWTVSDGQQPDPAEGHCIVKVAADGSALDEWVTWGARQKSTRAWTALCLDEAWAVIMHEDEIDPAALAALRADIDALHGTGGQPVPAPADAGAALRERTVSAQPATRYPVAPKAQAAGLAGTAAGVIIWALQTWAFKGGAVPPGLVSLIYAAVPGALALAAAYLAPHQARPGDLPTSVVFTSGTAAGTVTAAAGVPPPPAP